jgi:hypothetical protein
MTADLYSSTTLGALAFCRRHIGRPSLEYLRDCFGRPTLGRLARDRALGCQALR